MALSAGTVFAELLLNTSKYDEALKKAETSMAQFSKNMQTVGRKMTDAGKALSLKVTAPLMGVATASVRAGMDFEAAMSQVQAISGATHENFVKLEAKAKEMGAATKFSATDAANALNYMAMAGWDTADMLDGLDGVMMLAAASGEGLALTADITTDSLTAFGMQASQASEFADLLAKAASSSNTNVAMLGESFKYVAPLFGALGYSAEDAALALGLMANAGIKGGQAGTSLRAAISRLQKPAQDAAILIKELGLNVTDAGGQMLPFADLMEQLREKFGGLTEQQQAQYAATIFGQQAMSGMLAIINASQGDFDSLTRATRDYNGAAADMAEVMEQNLRGGITKLLSALEGVGLQIYEILLPHLTAFIAKLQALVDWFAELSPATQGVIVRFAALAAAVGPLLLIGGKLATSISSITGLFVKLKAASIVATGATKAAASVAGTAAQGFSAAGLAAKAGALLLNPWVLGIGAATAGGIALARHLRQDSIPAVQVLGKSVSEATQEALGGFVSLNEGATKALASLRLNGEAVTEEMASSLVSTFGQMAGEIEGGIDRHYEVSLGQMQAFFENSKGLTQAEQAGMLADMQAYHEQEKAFVAQKEARITEIMRAASADKRALTKAEQKEISQIQQEMQEAAVRSLSESEVESKAILERMKAQAGRITAEQAAEVAKNSISQRNQAISAADEQYDSVIKAIIRQRDEAGVISEEQAEKLIRDAKRQRDEAVEKADEMHSGVIRAAQGQAAEHVKHVDWETGEVMSRWQTLVASTESAFSKIGTAIGGAIQRLKDWTRQAKGAPSVNLGGGEAGNVGANALGTQYWRGGLTWVGEQGPELIELPRGSKVHSNRESEKMATKAGGIVQNVTINSPAPLSPSEIARKQLQASRQLAMEWGL